MAQPAAASAQAAGNSRAARSIEIVDEMEIAAARDLLWSKGYAVEPTAAVAAALVMREGAALRARHGDLAVVLTGSGLKT